MARLRNLSTSFLKPFQNPDSSHSRSVSQPLSLQTAAAASEPSRNKQLPSPRESVAENPAQPSHNLSVRRNRASTSRPESMLYGPPAADMGRQDVEELMPVFTFLSSHSNKLYQEGYFLKLNDLDTHGKPNADRNWTECFAQLVGTVLSLWDAAALDAAGQDGEVAPTFINLADASIKMIETLPTRNQNVQPLQNVLSVSTAGKNRYLLHFNSLHSLTQWTAGIRLTMFEHASLQELYTGSLIAGKGKHLNNIRAIMEKSRFRTEDWARVRFGAGTPWRRCWCVIEPPDEKDVKKALKKKNPYDRPSQPRGDIKFYDTKKTKKAMPIATITDAYSAYAIYPQSKPLIDQSTLVKVEGKITIHSNPESRTEGFVFVMPEVHPAVSGFEMMLRWLFPVYDVFRLYGRPERLIADTRATQGLMFAMPKEKRYGYLDIIDVAALIHTTGSERWTEREWRKQLKEATGKRMDMVTQGRRNSNLGSRAGPSTSFSSKTGVRYDDGASIRSQPSTRHQHDISTDAVFAVQNKPATAPPSAPYPPSAHGYHTRAVSESVMVSPSKASRQHEGYPSSRQPVEQQGEGFAELPPAQPRRRDTYWTERQNEENVDSQNSSDNDLVKPPHSRVEEVNRDMMEAAPVAPVVAPPTFTHQPGDRPQTRPNAMPELRREKSRMSTATLSQLVDASKNGTSSGTAALGAAAAWKTRDSSRDGSGPRGVNRTPSDRGTPANHDLRKGMVAEAQYTESPIVMSAQSQTGEDRHSSAHSVGRKPLPRSSSAHSVNRKPVPGPAPPIPMISANGSTLGLMTDASLLSIPSMQRTPSDNASQYSQSVYDRAEDSEPDHASTRKSSDTKRSESKSRTGVLKSVGNPEISNDAPPVPLKGDIPTVDFGPTQSLSPNVSRPGTAMEKRSPSATPSEEKRLSYLGNANPVSGRSGTPNDEKRPPHLAIAPAHGRTQSRSPGHPERAMAWQPGSGQQSPGLSLTPEEFVQQRAAAARMPNGYVPQRSRSDQNVPAERPLDSVIRRHSRNVSPPQQQDYTSRLSAHEQEYVARMTGTPLIPNIPDKRHNPDPSVGLIGAIEAREQEKRNMKEGVSGQMVQHAIQQRQVQSQAQLAAQYAYNYAQQQRPVMLQEAVNYNYPPPQQQPYGQVQPAQLPYNHASQQQQGWQNVDTRQNEQWVGPQSQHWGGGASQQGQYAPGQRQPGQSQPGPYYQQGWSGYRGPGQGQQ